jgi:hypothetical protein
MEAVLDRPRGDETAPAWLRTGVPLTLLLDVACLSEPHYATILGQALAREGVAQTGTYASVAAVLTDDED